MMMMMMMMMMMNYFCGMVDRRKCLTLFQVGTIVRDPHYREYSTRCKQDNKADFKHVEILSYSLLKGTLMQI